MWYAILKESLSRKKSMVSKSNHLDVRWLFIGKFKIGIVSGMTIKELLALLECKYA